MRGEEEWRGSLLGVTSFDAIRIAILEHPDGDTIAREDGSGGEFFIRADGTVWYRNVLTPDICFVNASESAFRQAVAALDRYNAGVLGTRDEQKQLAFVRRLQEELRELGALAGPRESIWPTVVEQAEHGTL